MDPEGSIQSEQLDGDLRRVEPLARKLHGLGLGEFAAWLLEAAGPLAFLGAQALYFAGPALSALAPEDEVTALARLLEDPASAQALAHRLSEDS